MKGAQQPFGGGWTREKLERIRKYLAAYTTLMVKQAKFRIAYVDAFAGTGYHVLGHEEEPGELLLPELAEQEPRDFLDGSARIALEVTPRFHRYIFIEKSQARLSELERLREDFPDLSKDIILVNADANTYLTEEFCPKNWSQHRAVLFLDPFGMQVRWQTIEAIAATQAIDMWYLFPLGVAVNRLLKRDGQISEIIRNRLNDMFGTSDWYDSFYKRATDLFGETHTIKTADFSAISKYVVDRLRTVFAGVAPNPLPLMNSRNNPLYLLCFAAGNERGAPTAIKIAEHILSR